MFDLLKKKFSVFSQKIQQAVSVKEKTQESVQVIEKRELKPNVGIGQKIKSVITGELSLSQKELAPFFLDLEFALLEADVELETAKHFCQTLEKNLIGEKFLSSSLQEQLSQKVKQALFETMQCEKIDLFAKIKQKKPFIVMFLGPNGAGKTTTIAKLGFFLQKRGLTVLFCAADTFRAAAIEQLKIHAEKLGIKTISHVYGSDPTAVAFDAVKSALAKKTDVVLIDTAGRQETNKNLLLELKKMQKVIQPDLKIFIAEAFAGQALLMQAKEFDKEIGINAFVLTKLDADAKGGTVISLLHNLKKPVLFIGTGQKYEDLEEFDEKKIIEKII